MKWIIFFKVKAVGEEKMGNREGEMTFFKTLNKLTQYVYNVLYESMTGRGKLWGLTFQ